MKLSKLISPKVLKRESIVPEVMERLERLAEYDLSFLTNNFTADKVRTFSPEQLFPLIKHFAKFKMKVDIEVAKRLELEFKRFVAIALLRPSRRNAPSGPVDMYWHFFILHTPEYVGFCTAIFGAYGPQPRLGKHYFTDWQDKREERDRRNAMVDHVPATEETRPAMNKSYRETRALYAELFGEPDPKYWPEPPKGEGRDLTTCGDSYSGFIHPLFSRGAVAAIGET
jgi:hypothetical protein